MMGEPPTQGNQSHRYVFIGACFLLVLCLTALLVETVREHDFRPWLLLVIVFSVIAWTNRGKWLTRSKKS